MEYVEFLRIRRALVWHAGILLVLVVAISAIGHSAVAVVHGSAGAAQFENPSAPFSLFAVLAGFFAAIFASSVGTSLNRESTTRDLSWTKPLSRSALATRFVLIDLAGVGIAFLLGLAGSLAVEVAIKGAPPIDGSWLEEVLAPAGAAAMWYGLLQVLTCAFPPSARTMAGVLWPAMLVLGFLVVIPGPIGVAVRWVNVLNPLGYFSYRPGDDARILIAWGCTFAFCAAAVFFWPRQEV